MMKRKKGKEGFAESAFGHCVVAFIKRGFFIRSFIHSLNKDSSQHFTSFHCLTLVPNLNKLRHPCISPTIKPVDVPLHNLFKQAS